MNKTQYYCEIKPGLNTSLDFLLNSECLAGSRNVEKYF